MGSIGQHTAILPNGAGKTSLIRMISLEGRPLARDGTPPRLFGRAECNVTELRTRLGIVTGDFDAGFGTGASRQSTS